MLCFFCFFVSEWKLGLFVYQLNNRGNQVHRYAMLERQIFWYLVLFLGPNFTRTTSHLICWTCKFRLCSCLLRAIAGHVPVGSSLLTSDQLIPFRFEKLFLALRYHAKLWPLLEQLWPTYPVLFSSPIPECALSPNNVVPNSRCMQERGSHAYRSIIDTPLVSDSFAALSLSSSPVDSGMLQQYSAAFSEFTDFTCMCRISVHEIILSSFHAGIAELFAGGVGTCGI